MAAVAQVTSTITLTTTPGANEWAQAVTLSISGWGTTRDRRCARDARAPTTTSSSRRRFFILTCRQLRPSVLAQKGCNNHFRVSVRNAFLGAGGDGRGPLSPLSLYTLSARRAISFNLARGRRPFPPSRKPAIHIQCAARWVLISLSWYATRCAEGGS